MAMTPAVRFPIVAVIRVIGVAVAALVMTWALHFRGGMSLISDNKDLIFNVVYSRAQKYVIHHQSWARINLFSNFAKNLCCKNDILEDQADG